MRTEPHLRILNASLLLIPLTLLCIAGTVASAPPPRWTFPLASPQLVMNPIIRARQADDGAVNLSVTLVPTNTSVYAFDLLSGQLLWRWDLLSSSSHSSSSDPKPHDDENAWATVSDSVGYVSQCAEYVFVGTLNRVFALNVTTGSLLWATMLLYPKVYNADRHIRADCFMDPWALFVTTFNVPLQMLDPFTGVVVRNFTDTFPNSFAEEHVHVTTDRVFFLSSWPESHARAVVALDKASLQPVYEVADAVNMLVAADRNLLFVRFSVNETQTVRALNATTGTEVWSSVEPGLAATFDYYYADGILFEATSLVNDAYPNNLTAYNATTGLRMWRQTIGFFYLLAGSGAAYAMGTVTVCKAYDAWNGTLLWSYDAVAVNDGAVRFNTLVFGTATSILALPL